MNNSFDIHPDFQSIKARTLSLQRWVLALMRYLLALVNVLHRRKFKAFVSRQRIAGPGGHRIPVQIIRPGNLEAACAALIYFRGGAFVIKHAPQHLENAVRYAREAGCCVVFVEYRLAPVHRFPAGFDDCHAALDSAQCNADALGIDTRRIAVGGDSAGGALAAAVAQRARHEDGIELCGQLLIYPVADVACTRPSTSAFTDVPPFKAASLAALWDVYFEDPLAAGVPRYAAAETRQGPMGSPRHPAPGRRNPVRLSRLRSCPAVTPSPTYNAARAAAAYRSVCACKDGPPQAWAYGSV